MPTYEYECQKCKKRSEVSQPITAKPLTICPKCRGKLKRVMSTGSGFLFKGSGFYITDYRSKGYQEAKHKDQGPPSSDTKKTDQPSGGSSDSKKAP